MAAVSLQAFAQEFNMGAPTLIHHWDLGTGVSNRVNPGAVYSNVTNFSGSAAVNGGATSTAVGTQVLMDDVHMTAGGVLARFEFSVANTDPTGAAINARVRIRMFDTAGAGGGPGTLTGFAFSFAPITFNPGVSLFFSDFTANNITLPQNLWVGTFFDGAGGATASVAQLNELGVGLFNPVDVGTSADKDFLTTAAGAPASNPAGTIRNSPFGGNPVANYGYEMNLTPEPGTWAVLGLGAIALLRRRRKA